MTFGKRFMFFAALAFIGIAFATVVSWADKGIPHDTENGWTLRILAVVAGIIICGFIGAWATRAKPDRNPN